MTQERIRETIYLNTEREENKKAIHKGYRQNRLKMSA